MTSLPVYIEDWAAFSPGLSSKADWQAWASGQTPSSDTLQAPVDTIPPMLRRRLSPLGKMALAVVFPLLRENEQLPCVFCSRHGELTRTVKLLTELTEDEPLSPTQFSLSVHNAIGGVLSIARKDTSCISALAVDDRDSSAAVMETAAILAEQDAERALCVFYDDEVPQVYLDTGAPRHHPFALALLLNRQPGAGHTLQLSLDSTGADNPQPREPQPLSLLRFLLTDDVSGLQLPGSHINWHWTKTGGTA